MTETFTSVPTQIDHQQLARELIEKACTVGVGPDGLLAGLTKTVLETARGWRCRGQPTSRTSSWRWPGR